MNARKFEFPHGRDVASEAGRNPEEEQRKFLVIKERKRQARWRDVLMVLTFFGISVELSLIVAETSYPDAHLVLAGWVLAVGAVLVSALVGLLVMVLRQRSK